MVLFYMVVNEINSGIWSNVYVQLHCTICTIHHIQAYKVQMLGPNAHAHFAQQLRSHHRLIFFVCVYLHMSIGRAVCLSYEPASKCNAYRPVKSYGLLKYGIVALSRILGQVRGQIAKLQVSSIIFLVSDTFKIGPNSRLDQSIRWRRGRLAPDLRRAWLTWLEIHCSIKQPNLRTQVRLLRPYATVQCSQKLGVMIFI